MDFVGFSGPEELYIAFSSPKTPDQQSGQKSGQKSGQNLPGEVSLVRCGSLYIAPSIPCLHCAIAHTWLAHSALSLQAFRTAPDDRTMKSACTAHALDTSWHLYICSQSPHRSGDCATRHLQTPVRMSTLFRMCNSAVHFEMTVGGCGCALP